MKKLNILVTGSGGGGHGAQIIKSLKFSNLDFNLFTADVSSISAGNFETNLFFILPPANSGSYISELKQLCIDKKIDVLFHGSEPELKAISDNRGVFEELGIYLPINSKKVIDICMDKSKTVNFLKENHLFFPKSFDVNKSFDLHELNDFPFILKPSVGAGGSQFTFIAQDEEELRIYSKLLFDNFDNFIIQEYVGNYENEFTIGVLSDNKGNLIDSISLRRIIDKGLGCKLKVKNKTSKKYLGDYLIVSSGISQGYISQDSKVCSQANNISKKLNSLGPINIQCRLVEDKLYVFEINPRFSGTSFMRTMIGFNEPEILISKNFDLELNYNCKIKEGYIMRGLEEFYLGFDS